MSQCPMDRFERQCSGSLSSRQGLVSWATIASAIALPAAIAAQPSTQSIPVQRKEPIPVTVGVAPPSPQYRLPNKLFISSSFRSVVCPDAESAVSLLQKIDRGPLKSREGSCLYGSKHIKITHVLDRKIVRSPHGRETHYLAFRGEIWEAKGHLDKVYGILNETAHTVSGYTELEDWQHGNAFFDGRLRRRPGVVKDTISCPKRSTPVELIKGRQLTDQNPADAGRICRLEALYSSCKLASGIFHPLAVLKRWEWDGWVWTALKAQDSNGNIVSLLHNAPKPHVAPKSPSPS